MGRFNELIRSKGLWLQIVIWGAVFLFPLTLFNPNEKMTLQLYLLRASQPLAMFIVFYLNFLWLAPQKCLHNRQRLYWTVNIVMIPILAFIVHECINLFWDIFRANGLQGIMVTSFGKTNLMFLCREIFIIAVAATIATGVYMSRQWVRVNERRRETEAARMEAELKTLLWQVNPHFMLNTLNNIYALTMMDIQKAQQAIMQLSHMLRHVLYDSQNNFIPIRDEIKFLRNYVNLMKIRISKDVEIKEHFEIPRHNYIFIAPMILISLVENAFKHGISATNKSLINIRLTAREGKITFLIYNTNYPKNEKDRSGNGIGLKQVEKKLSLIYPNAYTWEKGIKPITNIYSSKIIIYDTKLRNY